MKRIDVATKRCEGCKRPMFRKWYGTKRLVLEQPSKYAKRRFCDYLCKAIGMRKPFKTKKTCPQCGTTIHRKIYPSGSRENETTKVLRARIFCDVRCAALYHDERGGRARFLLNYRARIA